MKNPQRIFSVYSEYVPVNTRPSALSPGDPGKKVSSKTGAGPVKKEKTEARAGKIKKPKKTGGSAQELNSFTYVSSHDLQEPLRKIQTFSSRILEKEEKNLSDSGKDYFCRMQAAAQRMQTIIDDLVSFSRVNTADKVFKQSNLNQIVEEVKEDLGALIQAKDALIEHELCEARIIPTQFRQLMSNLVHNSLKFSVKDQRPVIRIKGIILKGNKVTRIKLAPQKKYCHITVSDNGMGFEPQFNERIFEIFQRLHTKDEFEGTGIGLAICKQIVENHSGFIFANGTLNEGASFDIYFPIE